MTDGSTPARSTLVRIALVALAGLLLLTSLAIVILRDDTPVVRDLVPRQEASAEEQRTLAFAEASEAASDWTQSFLEVDYKKMDPLIGAVLAGSTDPFRTEYDRAQVRLKALVQDNQTISTGNILEVGVGEVAGKQAVVFVAADSAVKNKSTKGKSTTRFYRLKLTLDRVSGTWLVSNVEFVG